MKDYLGEKAFPLDNAPCTKRNALAKNTNRRLGKNAASAATSCEEWCCEKMHDVVPVIPIVRELPRARGSIQNPSKRDVKSFSWREPSRVSVYMVRYHSMEPTDIVFTFYSIGNSSAFNRLALLKRDPLQ